MSWGLRLHRAGVIFFVLALLMTCLPQPAAVFAAPSPAITLQFKIVAVQAGQTVTIRTQDFPVRTKFVVRMDTVGKQGVGGPVVAEFNSDKGGVIEATYPLPAALRDALILAIRIESPDGYVASNWFINENTLKPLPNPLANPELVFTNVKKNTSVAVEAKNLPANTTFWVRVGPYDTFYKDYTVVDPVTTGPDGSVKFVLSLPKSTQNAANIQVRLDHDRLNTAAVFQNVDNGTVQDVKKLYKFNWCKVINTLPVAALEPGELFDAVWTLQNTSNMKWKASTIGYKYKSGEKMHKYADSFAIDWSIGDGWTYDVAVDMIAPAEPGWHTATWVMFRDADSGEADTDMCAMKISVFVKGE